MRNTTPKTYPGKFLSACTALFILLVVSAARGADYPLYTDSLNSGWSDWSWDATTSFSETSRVYGGDYSIAATLDTAWAGLYLHADNAVGLSGYTELRFQIHGGDTGGQQLRLVINGDASTAYPVDPQANSWLQVSVPLSELGNPATLTDIYWQDASGNSQPTFYLDEVILVASSTPPPPAAVELSINAAQERHPISENIYGINYADEQFAREIRLPVRRWGGNATTRYNWQTSMTNTGADWYFENLTSGTVDVGDLPHGSGSDQFVEQDRRTGTSSLLTIPIIGWTASADSPRSHPYDCGFKVSSYGPQQAVDPWDTDCGNGVLANGTNITTNLPGDTSTAAGPEFEAAWISHLTAKYGTAQGGGVAYYNLDNEPMLWHHTHRDIHPQPADYDEIAARTTTYGAAIKGADPSAKTLGPALWGWCAYFYSAADGCSAGADYQNHGNTPFVAWYLTQMQNYEQQNGVRLLDYLDLHYYPQASGVSLSQAGDASTQALRLRSTRALWDPTYTDESWISDTQSGGVAIALIPRMKEWVDSNYPGTGLAITEYNWGGLESINGALAQADVLGIFGREGVDLATLWSPPAATEPGAYAFLMYRNYDGQGNAFGDTSVQTTSTNQDLLAVYGARRSADDALTIMVINKSGEPQTSQVHLAGHTPSSSAEVYLYSAAAPDTIVRTDDQLVSADGFSATFPASSITLFVVPGISPAPIMLPAINLLLLGN